ADCARRRASAPAPCVSGKRSAHHGVRPHRAAARETRPVRRFSGACTARAVRSASRSREILRQGPWQLSSLRKHKLGNKRGQGGSTDRSAETFEILQAAFLSSE